MWRRNNCHYRDETPRFHFWARLSSLRKRYGDDSQEERKETQEEWSQNFDQPMKILYLSITFLFPFALTIPNFSPILLLSSHQSSCGCKIFELVPPPPPRSGHLTARQSCRPRDSRNRPFCMPRGRDFYD